ncbi:hypothetical protein [Leifsonia sp. AG29]|uniref:hypothetical protein n=1 Tax=Leifsonia sp. AG29 TaxID=2598860 RepID=UPI00131CCC84|nr:hypothetical protein [Leifsonia sp. AG29]
MTAPRNTARNRGFPLRILATITVTLLTFALSGCTVAEVITTNAGDQVVVPPVEFSTKTDRQTLDDALAHTDDLVQLLGGEWLDSHTRPFAVTNPLNWSHGPCGAVGTNQYSIYVQQVTPIADPSEKIEQVRQRWKNLHYRIRQIGPAGTDEEKCTEIVVDPPFGAGLGFNASTTGMGISTDSECIIEQ